MTKKRLVFCIAAALAGVAMILISDYVYGVGFLVFLAGALLLFIGWWALLQAPFQSIRARRTAKTLRGITVCFLTLGLLSFGLIEGLIYANAQGDADTDAPAIIVLGAGLRRETPSLTLKYRLDRAKTWLTAHPDAVAVLTGGQGPLEEITEAEAMRQYLIAAGIDGERLILEPKASNTLENISFSQKLLEERGLADRPVAVVSTDFHLYRVRRICERIGLDARMVSAPVADVGLVPLNSWLREYASVLLLYAKELLA